MKKASLVLAVVSVCVAMVAQASLIGDDNASNYTGSWTNGSNGGTGFGAWTLTGAANAGFFLGDSTANAGGASGGINTGGQSWGLYANTGDGADAYRPFTGALTLGQVFMIDFDNGWLDAGGPSIGFGLQNAASGNLWEFYFAGGDANYTIHDNAGFSSSGIGFTGDGLHIAFGLTSSTNYAVSVVTGGVTNNFTGSLLGEADQGVAQLHLWNFNAGVGANNDTYFNSMAIIPEPGTLAMLGIGLVGVIGMIRRRR